MKKIILCLLIMLIITGCGATKDKNTYVCTKTGVKDSSSVTNTSWEDDITRTAKLSDDKKLTYYSTFYRYMYETKEDCEYWCDIKVSWNDEFNDKKYPGGRRETKCACDKKELTEEYIYDDISNLASILRSDIRELKSDNSFDLDSWKALYEKNGYTCN